MRERLLRTGLLVVLVMLTAKMVVAQTSSSLQLDALMVEEQVIVEVGGQEAQVAEVTLIYGIPAEVGAVERLRDVPLPGEKMLDEEIMSELLTRLGGEQEGDPGTVERDAGKGEK